MIKQFTKLTNKINNYIEGIDNLPYDLKTRFNKAYLFTTNTGKKPRLTQQYIDNFKEALIDFVQSLRQYKKELRTESKQKIIQLEAA